MSTFAVSSMRHAYMMLAAVCSSALFLYAVECRNGFLYTFTVFQACSAVPWLHIRKFCRKRTDTAVFIFPENTWTRCSRHSQVKRNSQQEPKLDFRVVSKRNSADIRISSLDCETYTSVIKLLKELVLESGLALHRNNHKNTLSKMQLCWLVCYTISYIMVSTTQQTVRGVL